MVVPPPRVPPCTAGSLTLTDETPDRTPAEELAAALRQHRKTAGVSGPELARRTGYSQSTISRMERGDLAVSMLAAGRIAWALRLPRDTVRELIETARTAGEQRAGIIPIRTVLQHGAESVQRRIRLRERNVDHQQLYHPSILPGLLQTEGYMRLVAVSGGLTGTAVDRFVRERTQRKREGGTRRCTFLLPEGVLYQGMPDASVMAEQCDHLAEIATGHQFWRLGVVPRITPPGSWPNVTHNGFDIYDSREVFLGTTAGNAFPKDETTVREHVDLFARLSAIALWGEDAAALLRPIAADYRERVGREA